jgi:hypothetical protein
MTTSPNPLELLENALSWLDAQPAAPLPGVGVGPAVYARGLLRRSSGSWVEEVETFEDLRRFFGALGPPSAIEPPPGSALPGHRYLEAAVPPGYAAYEAAVSLEELFEEGVRRIEVARGEHGIELRAEGVPPRPTGRVVLVVREDDPPRLVTWFPGRLGTPAGPSTLVKIPRPGKKDA